LLQVIPMNSRHIATASNTRQLIRKTVMNRQHVRGQKRARVRSELTPKQIWKEQRNWTCVLDVVFDHSRAVVDVLVRVRGRDQDAERGSRLHTFLRNILRSVNQKLALLHLLTTLMTGPTASRNIPAEPLCPRTFLQPSGARPTARTDWSRAT